MTISDRHSGGNIKIWKTETGLDGLVRVYLEQDLTGNAIWWFYWNFEITDAPHGPIEFVFCNGEVVCPKGPAVCCDGKNWEYHPECYRSGTRFVYEFDGSGKPILFSFCIPYVYQDYEIFENQLLMNRNVVCTELTRSEENRRVPLIRFGTGKENIFLCSRSHCCESTGSYVLEGFIWEMLSSPPICENYSFYAAPLLDIDGVENGDQGKGRAPHDFNRDYTDKPIYNAIRAFSELGRTKQALVFLDFHSPRKWGGSADIPHLHLSRDLPTDENLQDLFVENLKTVSVNGEKGFFRFDGLAARTGLQESRELACIGDGFFKENCGEKISVTIESPYSGADVPVNVSILCEWGKTIAIALKKTLFDMEK